MFDPKCLKLQRKKFQRVKTAGLNANAMLTGIALLACLYLVRDSRELWAWMII
jgi:hypothetical protein